MRQHLVKTLAAAAVVAVLAGCGGGGGNGTPAAPQFTSPFSGTTVQSLLAYMNQLIAGTSETSEPEAVDNTPLPVDDTA